MSRSDAQSLPLHNLQHARSQSVSPVPPAIRDAFSSVSLGISERISIPWEEKNKILKSQRRGEKKENRKKKEK
jgi:hypothetical protein